MSKDFIKGTLVFFLIVSLITILVPFTPYEFSLFNIYTPLMNSESWIQNVTINYNIVILFMVLISCITSFSLFKISKK
ncbi:MAG: hypothetical protein ACRDCB_13965 [Clostridium sp.]|uniref:hypothetical protein n=1 Tax=Clostridium TaxID=1485 RepID=UPI0021537442|nr:hypothetical protein [Clostridium sp. LY3-2]MCR6514589.1 hypothetical protein [Clostridium sp. LY3-2]